MGKPVIEGTRITVELILLGSLKAGLLPDIVHASHRAT